MLPVDVRISSAARSFWHDAARVFDLFGVLSEDEQPSTTPVSAAELRCPACGPAGGAGEQPLTPPVSAAKSDQQALADDWKAVLGDLAAAWGVLKIPVAEQPTSEGKG